MIRIRVLGSLGKRLGGDSFTLDHVSISLAEAVKILYGSEAKTGVFEAPEDVLIAVNGVAVSGGFDEAVLESGDEVTLIPVSHGG